MPLRDLMLILSYEGQLFAWIASVVASTATRISSRTIIASIIVVHLITVLKPKRLHLSLLNLGLRVERKLRIRD